MAERPTFIDLRSKSSDGNSVRPALLSPRIQHFDGDVPPALSPLDAFAAQGRLLAKQLDESQRRSNRRVSRLPPATVTQSLSQNRPTLFRSPSGPELVGEDSLQDGDDPGFRFEMEEPKIRPKSEYTRISGIPDLTEEEEEEEEEDDDRRTPMDHPAATSHAVAEVVPSSDYFGETRVPSPPNASIGSASEHSSEQGDSSVARNQSHESPEHRADIGGPPGMAQAVQAPFMRPPHVESSDDDYTSSNAGSTFSHPRRLSSSSGASVPYSPMSPFISAHPRSPSLNSDISVGASRPTRMTYNFSRPLSSSSLRRSFDSNRDASIESQRPHPSTLHNAPMPTSFDGGRPSESSDRLLSAAPSYTYAKYSLPRGRMVSRDSLVFSGLSTPHFEWAEPLFESPSVSPSRSPIPPAAVSSDNLHATSASASSAIPKSDSTPAGFAFGFETAPSAPKPAVGEGTRAGPSDQRHPFQGPDQSSRGRSSPSPGPSVHSTSSQPRSSAETGDLRNLRVAPGFDPSQQDDGKSTSSKSNSTIRPRSARTATTGHSYASTFLTPEEHVSKGIECHQNGSLKESTYHLRIAAMQHHPTGMLLYALACRHGWGMRANQREGVQWLRKAVDYAVLEVADDEDPASSNRPQAYHERQAHRAQFALSIYELGVSHLNGWGIEQDKALALRCFEIAGTWGDTDALAEAGYCYAEGIGCKKDLKKAARFYRLAEAKGMSMVGNSWIYKEKYMDKDDDGGRSGRDRTRNEASSGGEKKPRNKSHTRSIFGRKKAPPAS